MEQTSRPATAADLKRVISALNASGAHYLLIGAYALFAHGYQRATTDIDFVVEGTLANGQRVQQALLVLADRSASELDPAWFTEGENIRVADEITVDLLFSPCAQTYDMLKAYEQIVDLDGVPVRTVSLEGLLLTKQSQRPQDVQDALILRRAIEAQR
jgi:predicted nucleotidyltransferase